MADTQDTGAMRPRLRPDGLADGLAPDSMADPIRPQARPERPRAEGEALARAEEPGARPRSRPEGLGRASEETQEAATLAAALPLDETTLIGLFHGPDGGSALLRLRGGGIVRVSQGNYVDGGRVTAISEDGVRLERGDRQVVLTMPS